MLSNICRGAVKINTMLATFATLFGGYLWSFVIEYIFITISLIYL
jgi:hypothetical protein